MQHIASLGLVGDDYRSWVFVTTLQIICIKDKKLCHDNRSRAFGTTLKIVCIKDQEWCHDPFKKIVIFEEISLKN